MVSLSGRKDLSEDEVGLREIMVKLCDESNNHLMSSHNNDYYRNGKAFSRFPEKFVFIEPESPIPQYVYAPILTTTSLALLIFGITFWSQEESHSYTSFGGGTAEIPKIGGAIIVGVGIGAGYAWFLGDKKKRIEKAWNKRINSYAESILKSGI